MGVRKTEEKIVDGVRHIKRVPNVPNHSTSHPLFTPPVSNLGQIPKKEKK